jgi:hypothetical protein
MLNPIKQRQLLTRKKHDRYQKKLKRQATRCVDDLRDGKKKQSLFFAANLMNGTESHSWSRIVNKINMAFVSGVYGTVVALDYE